MIEQANIVWAGEQASIDLAVSDLRFQRVSGLIAGEADILTALHHSEGVPGICCRYQWQRRVCQVRSCRQGACPQ